MRIIFLFLSGWWVCLWGVGSVPASLLDHTNAVALAGVLLERCFLCGHMPTASIPWKLQKQWYCIWEKKSSHVKDIKNRNNFGTTESYNFEHNRITVTYIYMCVCVKVPSPYVGFDCSMITADQHISRSPPPPLSIESHARTFDHALSSYSRSTVLKNCERFFNFLCSNLISLIQYFPVLDYLDILHAWQNTIYILSLFCLIWWETNFISKDLTIYKKRGISLPPLNCEFRKQSINGTLPILYI